MHKGKLAGWVWMALLGGIMGCSDSGDTGGGTDTETGRRLADDYLSYTDSIDAGKWRSSYTREGIEEIRDTLAVKNTIPNASAVLMRKPDIAEIEPLLTSLRHAGDWLLYIHILRHGKIHFCPSSLNHHRRHGKSVTIGSGGQRLMEEILLVQSFIKDNFGIEPATRLCVVLNLDREIATDGLDEDPVLD